MSLVLVVARPPSISVPRPEPVAAPARASDALVAPAPAAVAGDLWGTVRREVAQLRALPPVAFAPARLEELAAALEVAEDDPTVAYAPSTREAIVAVERAIQAGAGHVAVVPIGLAIGDAEDALTGPAAADLDELHRRLDALARRHPGVEVAYVGPPFHDVPGLERAIAALRPSGSEEPALLSGAIDRAFDGDLERFGRFMAILQDAAPPETRLVLRGSAVQGESYRTGEPFDARGPGTSDLDVVLLGEAAMAEWRPDAFYLPGVNSRPLWDEAPDVAPRLEPAREAAQAAAGRPVALQAMAHWFLDLRSGLQGTPYVTLGG